MVNSFQLTRSARLILAHRPLESGRAKWTGCSVTEAPPDPYVAAALFLAAAAFLPARRAASVDRMEALRSE
jgi:MYXO-CTERM domain-containing protein